MTASETVKPDVKTGSTAQGFYVIGASGKAFGFNNNRSVERVLQLMDRGLAAFKPETELKPDDLPKWEQKNNGPDPTISILRIFARVSPKVAGSDPANENVAQDHFWLRKTEVRVLLQTGLLPPEVVTRLYRFALVDNVRGEPDHWQPGELKTAKLYFEKLLELEGKVTYKGSGQYSMATANGARGLEGTLEGRLVIGVSEAKVVECRIYSEAKAWGRSTYTPNPPPGKFSMVFAIIEANDEIAKVVPPQAIFYGSEYFNPRR